MGMADIFDIDKADLSGLLESNEDLYVAQAIHKAFIAVNEKGTGNSNELFSYSKYVHLNLLNLLHHNNNNPFFNILF